MTTQLQGKDNRVEYIDFLKGIAAIMVVLVHATFIGENIGIVSRLNAGQMGCQLFFLLSGVTASISLSKNNIKRFYLNRLYGILPVVWTAVILFYFCDSSIFPNPYRAFQFAGSHDKVDILSNVFLLNGIFLHGNNNVIPGGWFIGCLVLLYAICPLAFRLIGRLYKKYNRYVILLPLIAFFVGYYLDYIFTLLSKRYFNDIFVVGYNSAIMQLSPFLYGIIAYYELTDKNETRENNRGFLLIITAILGILSILNYFLKLITGNVFIWSTFYYFLFWLVDAFWDDLRSNMLVKMFEKMGKVSFTMLFSHVIVFIYFIPLIKYVFIKFGIPTSKDIGWLLMMVFALPVIYWVSVMYKWIVDKMVKVLCKK